MRAQRIVPQTDKRRGQVLGGVLELVVGGVGGKLF